MQRIRDYIGFVVWQTGFLYAGLWLVTYWGLRTGPMVFDAAGVCQVDYTPVVFYWSCAEGTAVSLLARLIDWALTFTVWTPVYLAAATADPDALVLAGVIAAVHALGLPPALLVAVRLLQALAESIVPLVVRSKAAPVAAGEAARAPALARQTPPRRRCVEPRTTFGLRGPLVIERPAHFPSAPPFDPAE